MAKWIILTMQDEEYFVPKNTFHDIEEIAVTHEDGNLMYFNSLDEAHYYQEENTISGQCVELPLW
jgi:hypothetical protein